MNYRSNGIHQKQVFIKTMNAIAREDQRPTVYEAVKDDLSKPDTWWSNGIMEVVFGTVFAVTGWLFKAELINFIKKFFPNVFDCFKTIQDEGIIQAIKDYIQSFSQTQNTGGINNIWQPSEDTERLNERLKSEWKRMREAKEKLKTNNPNAPVRDIKCAEGTISAILASIIFGYAKKISESIGGYSAEQSVENLYQFLNNLGEGIAQETDLLIGMAAAAAQDGMNSLAAKILLEHLKAIGINQLADMSDAEMYTIGVALSVLIAALAVVAGVPAAISSGIAALIAALQSVGLAAGPATGAILEALRQMFPQYSSQLVIP